MSEPGVVLLVTNRHHGVAGTGDPPGVEAGHRKPYTGYFENEFGEQWIFCRDAHGATLRGGDANWHVTHEVSADGRVSHLILNERERAWLAACLAASAVPQA